MDGYEEWAKSLAEKLLKPLVPTQHWERFRKTEVFDIIILIIAIIIHCVISLAALIILFLVLGLILFILILLLSLLRPYFPELYEICNDILDKLFN